MSTTTSTSSQPPSHPPSIHDADDTTVSVSVTMDDWIPIASAVVLCCLIVCLIVKCSTDPSGSLYSVCQGGAFVFVAVLALIAICAIYNRFFKNKNNNNCATCENETFSNYQWGDDGFVPTAWAQDRRTRKIVGPDPTKQSLHTWQYNPQNSLVDYRFFTTHDNRTEQLAPIVHPEVGVFSGLPNVHVADVLGPESTRNPDAHGTRTHYVLQHPASAVPFSKPIVQYSY
jgi:hypothetical protein